MQRLLRSLQNAPPTQANQTFPLVWKRKEQP